MSERTLTNTRAFSFKGMASALSLLSFQLLNVNAAQQPLRGCPFLARASAHPPGPAGHCGPAAGVCACSVANQTSRNADFALARRVRGAAGMPEQHRGARTASGLPVQAQLGLGWDSDSGWPRLTRTNEQRTREVDLALRCRGRATVVFVDCFGLLLFLVQFGA